MAFRIFKYELTDKHPIQMPNGARILSVGLQKTNIDLIKVVERPFAWAIVDDQAPLVLRRFEFLETGQRAGDMVSSPGVPQPGVFLGSLRALNGSYMLHVFDMGETQP